MAILDHVIGWGIVGDGGSLGIVTADAAQSLGLTVPCLSKDLQAPILDILPKPGSGVINPIDIANPFMKPQHIREILLRASEDEDVDFQIVIQLLSLRGIRTDTGGGNH